jgi:DNA polymerase-1
MNNLLVIDFETDAIEGNPSVRPPKPVGVALKRPGYKGRYFAWGHPEGNNQDGPGNAVGIMQSHIDQGNPVLFHNGKFDTAVMLDHLGMTLPDDPTLMHDSMFQIFLYDPYAQTFSLKPSSERILGIKPDEADAVRDWVLAHIPCKPSEWGAHIGKAPASIVGPYAIGDVDRTFKLWEFLRTKIPQVPYQREQRLMPIVQESERHGIRVDMEFLPRDLAKYEATLAACDRALRKVLKAPNINLDSGDELADALDAAGLVEQWVLTPTGKRSVARENLEAAVANPALRGLLGYRGALSHCLSSFMRPWLELATEYKGRLHPDWNQVRQARGKDTKGTRTGRLSGSRPGFMNVPNEYDIPIPKGLPPLPIMRKYLLPDFGHRWLKRDYSQQELRILAHFTEGRLFQRYQENPRIDAHIEAGALVKEHTGMDLDRKYVKITGFSMIYGSGITALSESLGVDRQTAASIKAAYLFALPEVQDLMEECKRRGRQGLPITTWGGREYMVEPAKIINGERRTFEYKLLNYLIQGSAADNTKEAIIRWHEVKGEGIFLATVHDEIDICAPAGDWKPAMKSLREAMESVEFDVKMLSDGYQGDTWADIAECE